MIKHVIFQKEKHMLNIIYLKILFSKDKNKIYYLDISNYSIFAFFFLFNPFKTKYLFSRALFYGYIYIISHAIRQKIRQNKKFL